MTRARPSVAVWKFASCDGCQLSVLALEDELLTLAGVVEIARFEEAGPAEERGFYDISLVEGSITTPHDEERIQHVRAVTGTLVTIGACATAGGVQALRNAADVGALARAVYPRPSYVAALETSSPIQDHVRVDVELRGCPVDKGQLVEVVTALLAGRAPQLPTHPVCLECKAAGTTCLLVAPGMACLGPVTMAGCGALCPRWGRGCFGCFGPSEQPNTDALARRFREIGLTDAEVGRAFAGITAGAPAFHRAAREAFAREVPVEVHR
jgi:sulfhydrogenase subunit delta